MKTLKILLFTFLIANTMSVVAQSPELLNYQTVIRDNAGDILANQNVSFRISILETTNTGTSVYTETHSVTTTNSGLTNFQIGSGSVISGVFSTIDWGGDDHFLQIELDDSGGSSYQLMGTSQLVSVPYALHSKTAANVSGLESIDEGNGIGRRLINKPAANYDDIGFNAVDLSHSNAAGTIYGASGSFSTALGRNTTASGIHSTVMGYQTIASGQNATAMGYFTTALGNYSTAMGRSTEASSLYSTAIGWHNVGGGNPTSWVLTDPLFEIGNSTSSSSRTNALTILKNGTITAPTFDISEITDAKSLITKEYGDANYDNSGLEALDEGNGIGWRLIGKNPTFFGNIGLNATDLSNSTLVGNYGATGASSLTSGSSNIASGDNSVAFGANNTASQYAAFAMGIGTTASERYTTALGNESVASGFASTAMGRGTQAEALYATAIGHYNIGGGDPVTLNNTDPLFEIGNGLANNNRSNALTVLKNGTITAPSLDISEITDTKALITKEYADANYIESGLESLDEGNGPGWRLVGRDPASYGNIGASAVDLSRSSGASTTRGATGSDSMATGNNTTASEDNSTAMGLGTIASGRVSTAMGQFTAASGIYSTTMGEDTAASGIASTAMGHDTDASGDYSTAMGDQTTASTDSSTAMGFATNASGYASTAMGSESIASGFASTAMGDNTEASGNYSTAMGFSTLASKDYSTAIGYSTTASGLYSTATGNDTEASGDYSTAMGFGTLATHQYSTALGQNTNASGQNSTALGNSTLSSGFVSTAMGNNTEASGIYSTAMGYETIASGGRSTALGYTAVASGSRSVAMGLTDAESYETTTIGRYNVAGGSPTSWVNTDPLFEIGNGANNIARSNALTVLKNGTITAPTFDISEIIDAKALITKEYADANYTDTGITPTGLETLDEGNGIGWRLIGRNPAWYGNIGLNAVDLSFNSITSSTRGATGNLSIAMGSGTIASGTFSTAMGDRTTASGNSSTALGNNTMAAGEQAVAMGLGSEASGLISFASGRFSRAESSYATAFGYYNIGGGNPLTLIDTDPLFEIGNGTGNTSRSNALTVLKGGKIGINTATPQTQLQITGGTDAALTFTTSGYLLIGETTGSNLVFDTNEIMARNNSGTTDLLLQHEGGRVAVGGSIVHSSDRRLKRDIQNLNYGLEEILQLQPKSYYWKNRGEQAHRSLGLIAQEVQPIIKELVTTGIKDDMLAVNYTELIPILINAIKEQQEIIDVQQSKIEKLSTNETSINALLSELAERVSIMENKDKS